MTVAVGVLGLALVAPVGSILFLYGPDSWGLRVRREIWQRSTPIKLSHYCRTLLRTCAVSVPTPNRQASFLSKPPDDRTANGSVLPRVASRRYINNIAGL